MSVLEIKDYKRVSEVHVSTSTTLNSPSKRCALNFSYDLENTDYHISVDMVREPTQLDLFTIILYIDVTITWQLLPDAFLTKCMLDDIV